MKRLICRNSNIEICFYDRNKFESGAIMRFKLKYDPKHVERVEFIEGIEAENHEKSLPEHLIDEKHKYFLLSFCNSENPLTICASLSDIIIV